MCDADSKLYFATVLQMACWQARSPQRLLATCIEQISSSGIISLEVKNREWWWQFLKPLLIEEQSKTGFIDILMSAPIHKCAEKAHAAGRRANVEVVLFGDVHYPERYRQLYSPPICLYAKGNTRLLADCRFISVVGTRSVSPYGERMCRYFVSCWAEWNIGICSGMAYGVDSLAHRLTLEREGQTVAILGCGVDYCYPPVHRELYDKIAANGLIISEYPPASPPHKHYFPARNRLIAALGSCLVVIEAARRSGTMITTDHALEQGIPIFCVPGSVDAPQSKGTNALIRDGASILLEPDDVLPYLDILRSQSRSSETSGIVSLLHRKLDRQLFEEAKTVVEVLATGPLSEDKLASISSFEHKKFLECVTELELINIIKKVDGRYHLVRYHM